MASLMPICAGLVGPKSENVEKALVCKPFLVEKVCKKQHKEEKSACRLEMASMMHICSGLVGPKSENVDFSLVLQAFFKAQRGDEYSKEVLVPSGRSGFGVILGSLWGLCGHFKYMRVALE